MGSEVREWTTGGIGGGGTGGGGVGGGRMAVRKFLKRYSTIPLRKLMR